MQKEKRKSYYKSKRRVYSYDSINKAWKFTIASDVASKEYCYAVPLTIMPGVGDGVVQDLVTYKIAFKGSAMIPYQKFLDIRSRVIRSKEFKNSLESITTKYENDLAGFNESFNKTHGSEIRDHNQRVITALNDCLVYGV